MMFGKAEMDEMMRSSGCGSCWDLQDGGNLPSLPGIIYGIVTGYDCFFDIREMQINLTKHGTRTAVQEKNKEGRSRR